MHNVFEIESLKIGNDAPAFIVAEVGINHNGDMALAKESIHAAAEAGASAVKFQNYYTEDFISDRELYLTYISNGQRITEPQFDLFKRCELNPDQLYLLKETADACKINFHSTPTSLRGINDLLKIGVKILKNGSDYLTNLPLIQQMAETGLLTVLSTGMATLTEIDQAVQVFKEVGNENLILLHCTSSYPTPPEETNLSRIHSLKESFGVPVGFSDHTDGVTAATGAVLFGACWVEKHFTLDRNFPGPDHWFSMDPKELEGLVKSIRDIEKMKGSGVIAPTLSEEQSRINFRLSCVAARDITVGHILGPEDVSFKRPGDGIPPSGLEYIVGLKLQQSIKKGQQITKEHFL
jgi:N-acetylneuraminate synthase/N,N'-diacetyllegionaminate synthase